MKNKTYFSLIGFFFALAILFTACKKDDPIKLAAQMDTWGVRNITATTAELSGIVVAGDYTEYGVCWGTAANPTIDGDKASVANPEEAVYWVTAEGLELLTKYYARAYAISNGEVTYGEETDFTTATGLATISTDSIQDIEKTSATIYGTVTAQSSDASVTERGFCWSLTEEPTISDSTTTSGSGDGSFSVTITDLMPGTAYYVRAYATSIGGMVYGEELVINTVPDEYFLVGSINDWNNHGLYLANLGDDVHVGYQYLDDAAEFKILPVRDSWDNAWGRDGDNVGTVVAGGGNIKAVDEPSYTGADFYQIKFDLLNETVTLTPVTWGVIGNAQAGGWDTDVNLVYNSTSKKWEGQVDFLATGEYKFRANDAWDIDLGGALDNLVHGGSNIATPGTGTWNVTLDLGGEDNFSATVSQYPSELYMTGNGVGLPEEDWNWYEPLQLIPVHSHPELFWKIVWMKGTGEFKFAPVADWDGDFGKTGDADADGVYAKGGDNIPVPSTAGYYMVVVDMKNNTIQVTEPKVYGIGNAFGGSWTAYDDNYLFTVDNANEVIKFEGVPDSDDLRMHVAASTLVCDWWQAEVNIVGTDIVFRGTGGDPASFPVTSGQTISLNFKAGTAAVAK